MDVCGCVWMCVLDLSDQGLVAACVFWFLCFSACPARGGVEAEHSAISSGPGCTTAGQIGACNPFTGALVCECV